MNIHTQPLTPSLSLARSRGEGGAARTDWRRRAAIVQRELDRADLGDRATRLARVLVGMTLAEGRVAVRIVNRAELGRLLGIGLNHLEAVFDLLTASGIASCARDAEGWLVRVFGDSREWRCDWHFDREALCAYLSEVNAAPGQVQGELFEPEPCLRAAMAENAAEALDDFPKREAHGADVPKKGRAVNGLTVLQSSQLSPSSQLSEEAVKPGKLLNPEARARARGKAFTPTERELLDRLRAALGEEDVRQWGGYWVKHYIRPMPHALGVALDELHARRQEGVNIVRPAHWLQSTARHVEHARRVHQGNVPVSDGGGR